jgi:MFS family permease
MAQSKKDSAILNPRLLIFLLAMASAELSRTMTMVQIPIFLRELGASIQQIGLFFTTSLIFPLLLRIFGGWLSDAIGRLKSLAIGSIAGMLAFLAYAITPNWQLALLAPALLAVTTALIFPSYKAYIADQTREEVQGRVFGLSETIISIAWILGPPFGGLVAQYLGYRSMFGFACLSYAFATLIFLGMFLTRPRISKGDSPAMTLASMRASFGQIFLLMISGGLVTWILIVDGVRDISFKLSFDLMPIYLSEVGGLSKQAIGLLDGLFGVAIAATTLPAGWLVDRTSERFGITIGLIIMIISRLVFAAASAFWGFAFSWMLLGIGGGMLDPAGSSLIAKGVPQRVRGLTYGLVATSLGIFSLPAPWIGSQVWKFFGPQAPFILTAVIASITIIPAWFKLTLAERHWQGVDVDLSKIHLDPARPLPSTGSNQAYLQK